MQNSTRKPAGVGYYAAAVDADKMPLPTLALISAVLSALGFLAVAGLSGFIRFPSHAESAEETIELPEFHAEAAAPVDPVPDSPDWRNEHARRKAKLEEEIRTLNRDIELTRARAEKDRAQLERMVDDLNRQSAGNP